MLRTAALRLRYQLSRLVDDEPPASPAVRLFNAAIAVLIVVNVVAIVLESVEWLHDRYEPGFWWLEQVATAVFAAEYLFRLWTVVDLHEPRFRHPVWGRLRYMRSFFAVIDLIAILPAVLGLLGAGDLRVLRLLRLLRMLKLTRHSTVFALLWAVFQEEARSIGAVLFVLALTLTLSSSLMYMVEGTAQLGAFNSIPACMWWAIETLTTVGYGDMVPMTTLGRLLGGIVSVVGVAALALFTGLITVSFMDQLRLRREQLQKPLDRRLGGAPMAEIGLAALEQMTRKPGLSGDESGDALLQVLARQASDARCPHCGTLLLDEFRAARMPVYRTAE